MIAALVADGPGAAAHAARRRAASGARSAPALRYVRRHAGAGGAAGADGARRDLRPQLPGDPAAAGAASASAAAPPPTRRCVAAMGVGSIVGALVTGARGRTDAAPDRRRRARLRRCSPLLAAAMPSARAGDPGARPARRRRGHLRRRDQLLPAAGGRAGDAGAGDGALLGRLPRLDADRRPARRLARARPTTRAPRCCSRPAPASPPPGRPGSASPASGSGRTPAPRPPPDSADAEASRPLGGPGDDLSAVLQLAVAHQHPAGDDRGLDDRAARGVDQVRREVAEPQLGRVAAQ